MVRNIEADEKRLEEIRAWQEEALATGALVPRREAFLIAQLDAALARAEKAEKERDGDREVDVINHDKFLGVCEERDAHLRAWKYALEHTARAEAERDEALARAEKEREACAKVAQSMGVPSHNYCAEEIAAAIRARGGT